MESERADAKEKSGFLALFPWMEHGAWRERHKYGVRAGEPVMGEVTWERARGSAAHRKGPGWRSKYVSPQR